MFNRLSENIAFLLIKNKILDIENRDIYIYSLEVILLNLSIVMICFLMSIFTNSLIHFAAYVLFFIPLRILVGGYHCNHSETCLMLSVSVYVATIFMVKYKSEVCTETISVVIALTSCIVILIWSPLINKNHPLDNYRISRNKKIIYGIIIVDFVLFIILSKYNLSLASSEAVFVILVALTLILGMVKDKKMLCRVDSQVYKNEQ